MIGYRAERPGLAPGAGRHGRRMHVSAASAGARTSRAARMRNRRGGLRETAGEAIGWVSAPFHRRQWDHVQPVARSITHRPILSSCGEPPPHRWLHSTGGMWPV